MPAYRSASRLRKRRMRASNSVTSSASNALPKDSMATVCSILPNAPDGAADPLAWTVGPLQLGKTRLNRLIAAAQGVIIGVRDNRRIIPVIGCIMCGNFIGQTGQLRRRFAGRPAFRPANRPPSAGLQQTLRGARASSVISAPDNMRATSSSLRRRKAARHV